jgi:ring-1,2-phenylacetyl-CoA epoxidase subunit PaaA
MAQAALAREITEEANEIALQTRVKAGGTLEDISEMTPRYRSVLVDTMKIAADLEIMTLPLDFDAILFAPGINDRIAITSALQDEMGHAQVMFRMLEDFGIDAYERVFERDPASFKTFFMLEFAPRDAIDTGMGHLVGDQAGYITTCDLEANCSFGPYSRSLRKVNFEENFHVKRGEYMIRHYMQQGPEIRRRVQESLDFWFPMGAEWFGATDDVKSRTDQLHYRIRGSSNDQLRQIWMQRLVPFCEQLGLKVPAHFDREKGIYVLDFEMPILLNLETLKWDFRKVTWAEKLAQWKRGGPAKVPGLSRMQTELWGQDLW